MQSHYLKMTIQLNKLHLYTLLFVLFRTKHSWVWLLNMKRAFEYYKNGEIQSRDINFWLFAKTMWLRRLRASSWALGGNNGTSRDCTIRHFIKWLLVIFWNHSTLTHKHCVSILLCENTVVTFLFIFLMENKKIRNCSSEHSKTPPCEVWRWLAH